MAYKPTLCLLIVFLASITAQCQPRDSSVVDTSIYTILKYNEVRRAGEMDIKFHHPKPTPLSAAEVDSMEVLIENGCLSYNEKHPGYRLLMPLKKYKRQYVAIIDSRGKKGILINFFCEDDFPYWRNREVIVDDGGPCFFHMIINLTTKTIIEIAPNGVG